MNDISSETLNELQQLLESLTEPRSLPPDLPTRIGKLLRQASQELTPLFNLLHPLLRSLPTSFLDQLGDQTRQVLQTQDVVLDDDALDFVEEALLRASATGRWNWLTVLAVMQSPGSLDIFVRELLESEVADHHQPLQAFAPLMRRPDFDPAGLFPALFAGLSHAILAPVIVDLANFCFREGLTDEHPATERESELLTLLDQLAGRLLEVENDPTSWSSDPQRISRMISDSVALIVSLCDTMALLQNQNAIPTIEKVARLRHRRVRAEACFALAKLGTDSGREALLELVQEPVSRLRVIQYADELGLASRIDDRFRSPESLAESELALWLSQPSQMGVPPSNIELIDQRNLYWPSYDDPVDCFLFRFEYRLGENHFSNFAVVGPLVHTFVPDLQSLDLEDCYAAFAGWQAEHEEIFDLDLESLSPHRQTDRFKLERRLHDYGATEIQTNVLGLFFGEVFAVARCQVDGQPRLAVVDGNQIRTFPLAAERPLDEPLVRAIHIGNKLIRAFNP